MLAVAPGSAYDNAPSGSKWTSATNPIASQIVKYFYALTFAGAGALLLLYVYHFARQGEMPIRGATFERRTNAPAFWLFAILFSLAGIGAIIGAVAILRSDL